MTERPAPPAIGKEKGSKAYGGIRATGDRSALVPWRIDFVFGLSMWVVFTAMLVLLGSVILPGPNEGMVTAAVYLAVCVGTAALLAGLAGIHARLTGQPLTAASGLRLGAVCMAVGLFLDGLLLAVTGFAYPNVDAARTETIAIVFLLAYPLVVVAPWWIGYRAEVRGT